MADPNGSVNRITPATAPVMGQNIDVIADVNPEKFPHGLELMVMAPGGLEALGKWMVRPGCMIGIIPPEMAMQLRALMRQAVASQRPVGPGLGG